MTSDGRSRALTRKEFESVMKRATELAASDPDGGEATLDEAEVLRIAREVGIPDEHVQQALVEVRSADVPETVLDRWFGNANIRVSRIVPGHRKEIADSLDEFLVGGHLLSPVRKSEEVLLYRPAEDLMSKIVRAGASVSGKANWASSKEFEVRLRQVDDESVAVELDVDPGIRSELVAGGIVGGLAAGGGVGFAVGLVLSTVAMPPLVVIPAAIVVGGAMASAVAWATGISAKKKRESVREELEGVLDTLEGGYQLNPPPASWRRWMNRQANRLKEEFLD